MGGIVNFEDLQVWQKSHKLVFKVYEITKGFSRSRKIWIEFTNEKSCCFHSSKYSRRV